MKKSDYIIRSNHSLSDVLKKINNNPKTNCFFVNDDKNNFIGIIAEGDIRRAIINGYNVEHSISEIINRNYSYLSSTDIDLKKLIKYRENGFKLIPILNEKKRLVDYVNFNNQKSYLPAEALIMAGGLGSRLRPLTNNTPKPLIKVNEKPIIQYVVEQLIKYGVKKIYVSIGYLGSQIIAFFKENNQFGINVVFIEEDKPLGTIGCLGNFHEKIKLNDIIVINSDILTDINYESFYLNHVSNNNNISIASFNYKISIPYAVLELNNKKVSGFSEKPKYNFACNAGIYIINKSYLNIIPKNKFFNATDLIDSIIDKRGVVGHYQIKNYWRDIGAHEDLKMAEEESKKIFNE